MKALAALLVSLFSASVLAPALSAQVAARKPRVFVTAMETRESFGFLHERQSLSAGETTQTTETQKLFVQGCPGVIVTVKQSKADYTFSLARQSTSSRGLIGKRDKWTLADKDGDLIGGNSVHKIANAVKDACTLIEADATKSK